MGIGRIFTGGGDLRYGDLILFSGIDGAGKTTQILRVESELKLRGISTRRIWARGGYTPLFSLAKRTLRSIRPGMLPPPGRSRQRDQTLRQGWVATVWLNLAIYDLFLFYCIWTRWLQLRGYTVLCDRYVADTVLDFSLNYPQFRVDEWISWKLLRWAAPQPTVAFMLLVPVGEALKRSRQKDEPFPDSSETLERRYQFYAALCATHDWRRVDGRLDRAVITNQLMSCIDESRPVQPGSTV